MFGMDARVALVIASVLAATGGVSVMSKLERNRVTAAEYGVQIFLTALENYYKTINLTRLPKELTELFSEGLVEDAALAEDPWGGKWNYSAIKRDITIENIPVTVNYAVVASPGKNGITESEDVATPAEWDAWAPKGDDIGTKFSTIEIEKKRVETFQQQGQIIVTKLEEFEQTRFVEVDTLCSVTPNDPQCFVSNELGQVITQENFNFYPKSSLDETEGAFYYGQQFKEEPEFLSGDKRSMEDLMALLKLPAYFAVNPWGEVLTYHSNIYQRPVAPFRASIWVNEDGDY